MTAREEKAPRTPESGNLELAAAVIPNLMEGKVDRMSIPHTKHDMVETGINELLSDMAKCVQSRRPVDQTQDKRSVSLELFPTRII